MTRNPAPPRAPRAPQRVQRKRTKGWRMPPDSVYVGRPSRWGNPYRVGADNPTADGPSGPMTVQTTVALYDASIFRDTKHGFWYLDVPGQEAKYLPLHLLRGKTLVCWCPVDGQPCHADVLLELVS